MRKVFSSKTSLLIERSGVKLMIIKMVTMIISFGSTSGKLLGQQDLLITTYKDGEKMTISYVQSIFLLLWKVISTTIKKPNRKWNKRTKQEKKKGKKIKISSIQGKGPQTLLSGGHACFSFGAPTSRFAPTVVSHSVDLYLNRTIRTMSV